MPRSVHRARRAFLQKILLTAPALSALSACGGGGSATGSGTPTAASVGGTPTTTGSTTAPTLPASTPVVVAPAPAPVATPSAPSPTTPVVTAGTDLFTGVPQVGKTLMPYSPLPKPAKGVPVLDPDFGAKIIRITDCQADFQNLCAAPAYPTAMAWNCDESRFILYLPGSTAQAGGQQGWALYDGTTYAFLGMLDINPADVEQFYWDRTDPSTLRYIDNHMVGSQTLADLTAIDVDTGVKTIVYSFLPNGLPPGFPTVGPVRCGYPFALGINAQGERIWGLGAGGPPNVSGELGLQVFGFNETTKVFTLYDPSVVPQPQARGSTPFASVSGQFFVWNAAPGLNSTPTTQSAVLDAATGKLVRWINFDSNEHCDTAMAANGNDLLVGSQFSRNTGGNGNAIVCNLNTGAVANDVGESSGWGYPVTGSLTGATAWANPSWAVTGMTGDVYGTNNSGPTPTPTTVLDQEIMLTNLSTGETRRIAHHRSTGNYSNAAQSNYWAQTNVTLSPSGTRILFQSDWGNADPSNPVVNPNAAVDTYVLILPTYKG